MICNGQLSNWWTVDVIGLMCLIEVKIQEVKIQEMMIQEVKIQEMMIQEVKIQVIKHEWR